MDKIWTSVKVNFLKLLKMHCRPKSISSTKWLWHGTKNHISRVLGWDLTVDNLNSPAYSSMSFLVVKGPWESCSHNSSCIMILLPLLTSCSSIFHDCSSKWQQQFGLKAASITCCGEHNGANFMGDAATRHWFSKLNCFLFQVAG